MLHRMKAYEILQKLPDDRVTEIILFMWEEERDTYRAILITVAQEKRLRPEFVQKKPRTEQAGWLSKALRTKKHDQFAEHFTQVWLMKEHRDLLVAFLDGMGIEHDGEGSLEEIPEKLDAKKYADTLDALFEKFDDGLVALYLHVFNLQTEDGYPEIHKSIEEDKRASLAG